MARKLPGVDYLRVYPGLNDFSDVLEAIPLEMVRHFTLLKEIDAKCTVTSPQLATAISKFMVTPRDDSGREADLLHIRQLLQELMPCLEEKMHIASMASEAMARHMERLDADYQLIVNSEIPKHIQIDEDNPALSEAVRPADKPAATRSEARREAIAAKRAAAAAAAASDEAQISRQGTPVAHGASGNYEGTDNRRKRGAGQAAAHASNLATFNSAHANANSTHANTAHANTATAAATAALGVSGSAGGTGYPGAAGGAKRRREQSLEEEESLAGANRRRRGPADREEPVYCYCEQGSYGDMVGCDGPECKREWFHLGCIGLSSSPKGQWFCEECQAKLRPRR